MQKRFVSNDSHVVEKNVNVLETVPQIENVEDVETIIQSDTNDTDDLKKVSKTKIKTKKQAINNLLANKTETHAKILLRFSSNSRIFFGVR